MCNNKTIRFNITKIVNHGKNITCNYFIIHITIRLPDNNKGLEI